LGATLAALALVAFVICTRIQLGYWRNSVTLFSRAVAVSHDSIMSEYNLAEALARAGDQEQAAAHYLNALEIHPNRVEASYNSQTAARFNLGAIYAGQARWPEAEAQFREILRGEPDHTRAHEALGSVLMAEGRAGEASDECRTVTRLEPGNAKAWQELGMTLSRQGRGEEALKACREALRLSPDSPAALNDLGWLLATLPDAKLRDGAEALRLAQRACDLTQRQEPLCLATLDAAYAETGQFPKAIESAEETKKTALANRRADLAAEADKRRKLYRDGKPYHSG
jgi:tetratricopeptide (TPR) repeat protein